MLFILEKGEDKLSEIEQAITELWGKSDKKVVVSVELEKKIRSTGANSQNHHLNGHIQQICEVTGNDFNDIKNYVKMQSLKRGYPVKFANGAPRLSFKGDPIPISESDSSSVECGYLIEEVHILASELGIELREN